jgi:hypothetical protein
MLPHLVVARCDVLPPAELGCSVGGRGFASSPVTASAWCFGGATRNRSEPTRIMLGRCRFPARSWAVQAISPARIESSGRHVPLPWNCL